VQDRLRSQQGDAAAAARPSPNARAHVAERCLHGQFGVLLLFYYHTDTRLMPPWKPTFAFQQQQQYYHHITQPKRNKIREFIGQRRRPASDSSAYRNIPPAFSQITALRSLNHVE
jgi:hypothetical protein